MAKGRILVVDDEERMRKLLRDFLVRDGYTVLEAADGEAALKAFFAEKDIDLVLLDVMMPKMDGWQVLTEIRRFSTVPAILLTARAEEQDELKGFSLGVDEYVTKPFSPRVLVARIAALLKRRSEGTGEKLTNGAIELDKTAREVWVNGKSVDLSLKEFELLAYFMENPGVALSRETILNRVWNYNYYGDARTVDTHVKTLRSKVDPNGEYITTVWGIGYKFKKAENP